MANTVGVQPRAVGLGFRNAVVGLSKILNSVGIVVLMIMMLATVVDVVSRWFETPVQGAVEVVTYTMVVAIFWCIGHVQAVGGNISVELLYDRFSDRTKSIFRLGYLIAALVMFSIVSWAVWLQVGTMMGNASMSGVLELPDWPFYAIEVIGYVTLSLVLLTDILMEVNYLAFGYEAPKEGGSEEMDVESMI